MTTFTGSAAGENITPNLVSSTIVVNGSPARPSDADDTIEAKGGADTIDSGGGNDFVEGGPGDDTVQLGTGNDTFVWRPGDQNDTIEGGAGFDTLDINGSPAGLGVEISTQLRIGFDVVRLDHNDIERVRVRSPGGAIQVDDLRNTDITQVEIDLTSTVGGNTANGRPDHILVNATNFANNIIFSVTGTAVTFGDLPEQMTIDHAEAQDELFIAARAGNDRIDAAALTAANPYLIIDAGEGDDTVRTGGGNDTVELGLGNDTYIWAPGGGSDTVEGNGGGVDVLQFTGSNGNEVVDISRTGDRVRLTRDIDSVALDTRDLDRIELDTIGGADSITVRNLAGTATAQVAIDLAGTANGTTGDGQRDRVTFIGETGADEIAVDITGGNVRVSGTAITVVTVAHADAQDELTIASGDGPDFIYAANLTAGHVRLTLLGGAAVDNISGSAGDDTLEGGAGGDFLGGGPGSDMATYATSPAGVRIDLGPMGMISGGDAQGDSLFAIENLTGSAHNDELAGNDSANVLIGGAGSDVLKGAGGDDTLAGGLGNDSEAFSGFLYGGAGTDTALFTGNRANYRIDLREGGLVEVVDLRPGQPYGTDTLFDLENLAFADGTFAPVAPLGDVVWRHSEGSVATGLGSLGVVSNSYQIAGTGDFDSDGDADIVWRHDNGMVVTWDMEDGRLAQVHALPTVSNSFRIAGTGDFDADGDSDILWRGDSGAVVTWEMEAGNLVTPHSLPAVSTTFQVAGTGDFDGDGDSDILWRGSSGAVVTWEMEGGQLVTNHNLPQVSTSFQIAATGDFDADGDADVLWRGNAGQVVTWDMEDGALVTTRNLPQVATSFDIVGTADFDSDGDSDILWRGETGAVVSWDMENGSFSVNHNFGFVANSWQIRGTGEFDFA